MLLWKQVYFQIKLYICLGLLCQSPVRLKRQQQNFQFLSTEYKIKATCSILFKRGSSNHACLFHHFFCLFSFGVLFFFLSKHERFSLSRKLEWIHWVIQKITELRQTQDDWSLDFKSPQLNVGQLSLNLSFTE